MSSPLLAIAILCVLAASAFTACGADARGESATVAVHYSAFGPTDLTVPAGVPVTFTLRNDDPIEHEWIVGPEDVHEAHRTGTEAVHNVRPTEVTLPAFTTRETTITFDRAGTYAYICHLPGHEAYGMIGTLTVVEG